MLCAAFFSGGRNERPNASRPELPATVETAPLAPMPKAILGKWKKPGGEGCYVFDSLTSFYWTDGTNRFYHKMRIDGKDGVWVLT